MAPGIMTIKQMLKMGSKKSSINPKSKQNAIVIKMGTKDIYVRFHLSRDPAGIERSLIRFKGQSITLKKTSNGPSSLEFLNKSFNL